jgi:peptidoglycan hydrolase-like protein with peptidoglycan-binding domain
MQFINLPERCSLPIGYRVLQCVGVGVVALGLATAASAATSNQTKAKHGHHNASRYSKHFVKSTTRSHGQRSIDEERTLEIQNALIREHYLNGEPTGVWDQASKEAMVKFQGDNGWQTKITPDSRALIKLGLGPDHKGLLNPETANIPNPHELGADNVTQPGGAADSQ